MAIWGSLISIWARVNPEPSEYPYVLTWEGGVVRSSKEPNNQQIATVRIYDKFNLKNSGELEDKSSAI